MGARAHLAESMPKIWWGVSQSILGTKICTLYSNVCNGICLNEYEIEIDV